MAGNLPPVAESVCPIEGADEHNIISTLRSFFGSLTGDDLRPVPATFGDVADFVAFRVNQMLAHVIGSPEGAVPGVCRGVIVLHSEPLFNITLGHIGHSPNFLYWTPTHAHIYKLDPGEVALTTYRVPDGLDNVVVKLGTTLQNRKHSSLSQGGLLERDGRRDVVDFDLRGGSVLLARIQAKQLGTLEWMFDRTSLAAVGATALQLQSTQIETS